MSGALEGIRVADFTWWLAGPTGAMLLALLGAEVIKIESLKRLDGNRIDPNPGDLPPERALERLMGFHDINLNKLGLRLDIGRPEGAQVARELIRICDVVVENFRPGGMEHYGLGYQVLRQLRPDIILVSVSYAGQSGPESGMPGMAKMFQAAGGLGELTGYPEDPPAPVLLGTDCRTGFLNALGALAALNYRMSTGKGTQVDLSAREGVITTIGEAVMGYTMNQEVKTRKGNRDDLMAPHNCYPCKGEDKWVSIAVATQEEWEAFCKATGLSHLFTDPGFADQYSRWKNQETLDRFIGEWTIERTPGEVMELLQGVEVAAFPSFNAEELCNDPHTRARSILQKVTHPEMGTREVLGAPWKMSETPPEITRPAPLLGQHTSYILRDLLGKSEAEVQELAERKVLY